MKQRDIKRFRDIPNVGVAIEKDFFILGMGNPNDLIGKDPYQMYNDLCTITQQQCDPCVIDVFISAVQYMEGGPPKKWWEFTQERKKHLSSLQRNRTSARRRNRKLAGKGRYLNSYGR